MSSTINKSDKLTGDSCVPRMFRANQAGCAGRGRRASRGSARAKKPNGRSSPPTSPGAAIPASSFVDAAKINKKEIVAEIYAPFGSNDYAPFIQQIKSSGAEGLWVALAGRDAINFATQAKEFGILDKVFVAGVSFVTDSQRQDARGAPQRASGASSTTPPRSTRRRTRPSLRPGKISITAKSRRTSRVRPIWACR